jgi:EAL domain-containing protein (putative c-di-GMP-specific phosphodiesterase class I)
MYVAKNREKGRFEFYQHGMHARLSERQALEADLRQGILRDELVVHYQPAIFLSSGHLAGAEALVRWNHPTRGLIPPNEFIPIAEESGMILEVGEYVLRDAVSLIKEWQTDPRTRGLLVGVNVSARQLRNGFVESVRNAIELSGIDPGHLVLELTESAIVDDPDAAFVTLTQLKDLGVQLALDDFGTGYSSLSYLKRFPIDVLKIDKSFVEDISLSEQDSLLAKATIAFGKQLRLSVLAEGIEHIEQLEQLLALDCEVGQGFYFSRPLPRVQFDAFVKANLDAQFTLSPEWLDSVA